MGHFDYVIAGSGITGACLARTLAEEGNCRVLVLERRHHMGGNCYDHEHEDGLWVHRYGPHIFHTGNERVFEFLSRFTAWRAYRHKVLADVHGLLLPVPFNWGALEGAFGVEHGASIRRKLLKCFEGLQQVSIQRLMSHADDEIAGVGQYVYEHIYRYYSQKQWGESLCELNESVLARVPVRLSGNDDYFVDRYQGIPAQGYAALFERLLSHPNITLWLGCDALHYVHVRDDGLHWRGMLANEQASLLYTGKVDELFAGVYGKLAYRAVYTKWETQNIEFHQPVACINYTTSKAYIRQTEYKWLTGQVSNRTVLGREYVQDDGDDHKATPAYPILTPKNLAQYDQYAHLAQRIPGLHLVGRLAEYSYLNMDQAVAHALVLSDRLLSKGRG